MREKYIHKLIPIIAVIMIVAPLSVSTIYAARIYEIPIPPSPGDIIKISDDFDLVIDEPFNQIVFDNEITDFSY